LKGIGTGFVAMPMGNGVLVNSISGGPSPALALPCPEFEGVALLETSVVAAVGAEAG